MRRNFRIILMLVRYKLSRNMMFRFDAITAFFVDGLLFVVQLLTFNAIYAQVDAIGTWGRGEMTIFVGTFSMINALNMTIFFFGILALPDKIRRGDLDQYITKPVNPLLRLTFENVNPGSSLLVVMSALIIARGVSLTGTTVSFGLALGYALLVLLMTVLWYDMELILRTLPFFVLSINGISALEGHLIDLNFKIPGILYRGAAKIVFYFILPYGIMSTVPTQFITRTISPVGVLSAAATAVAFTAFALWFFRFGLKHYKSASS